MARWLLTLTATALVTLSLTSARAGFSTSVMKPTPVGSTGVISEAFPASGGKLSYYFSLDLQKGDLLTQISFDGRVGAEKQVELALLDSSARVADSYWIHGADAKEEGTRSFPIDSTGRRLLCVTVQGPETGGFRVEFGGSAFVAVPSSPPSVSPPSSSPPPVQEQSAAEPQPSARQRIFSPTVEDPTPVDTTGVISALFPAGGKTHYYFAAEVHPGALLTQISYQGRAGSDKEVELALLDESGRVADSYWVHGSEPNQEATRRFSIDRTGHQILRLAVQGPETGEFRVDLGGPALAGATPKQPLLQNGFSRSVFTPTHVEESGVIAGPLPGNTLRAYYYFAVNTQQGDLLTQIAFQGREGAAKELELSVLGPDARVVNWYWIHGSDAQEEATRSFPIDVTGATLIRVMVTGPETGTFRIELGGSALASGTASKDSSMTTSQSDF